MLQIRRQRTRAAQNRADARQQFARRERLREVVVGAHLETEDAVGFFVARREHQNRRALLAVRAQIAAQLDAVLTRQHQVEHDQVDVGAIEQRAHLAAVRGDAGADAVLLEIAFQQIADVAIVVYHQYVICALHGVL